MHIVQHLHEFVAAYGYFAVMILVGLESAGVPLPGETALVTAARALDRVLLWGWYMVPQWHLQKVNIAYWNRFGHPSQPVRTGVAFGSWWVDPALAAATDAARAAH